MEIGIGIHGEPGRQRVPLAPAARDRRAAASSPILADLDFTGGDGVHRLRQRHGRHAADRAVPDVRRGRDAPREGRRARSPGRWSGRTSPAWTWPAARSRCSRSTTSCCGCGTRRCGPRPCGGESDASMSGHGATSHGAGRRWMPRVRRGWSRRTRTCSPSSTPRSATPTTASTWTAGMTAVVAALDDGAPPAPAALLKQVGMTLVSTVGGASGPLYGTFFLRMATAAGDVGSLDAHGVRQGAARRAGRRGRPRQGRGRRQDDVRRAGAGRRRAGRRAGRRGAAAARRCAAAVRGRRGGPGRDDPDARPQGPGQLPRRAQRRPPGPRRHVRGAARRRRRDARWPRPEADGDVRDGRASSSSRTAAPWPVPRSRWPRRCCTARQVRIEVAAGLDDDHVRHRRRADHGGDHSRRQRRRRRGPDGPGQRRALRRARARPARRRASATGGALPGAAGRGPRRRRGRRGGRRRPGRGGRRGRGGAGRQAVPPRAPAARAARRRPARRADAERSRHRSP